MKKRVLRPAVFLSIILSNVSTAFAQGKYDQPISQPLVILIALSLLALLPIVLIMMTSFVKISVVLALVRNALGTQQIPPNQVVTGLALILTIYIMVPVGIEAYKSAESVIQQGTNQGFFSQATIALAQEAAMKAKEPVRTFLKKQASVKEVDLFYNLARQMRKEEDRAGVTRDDFLILIPSFVVSELTHAFKIGFVVFLPFLVIDMVVSNILLALGMFQLSPVTVSLPFKLLLFVVVDGWYYLARGLILGYL